MKKVYSGTKKERGKQAVKKYHSTEKGKAARKRFEAMPGNKTKKRAGQYRRKYGVTLEQYDEMFEAQGGVCAICNEPSRMLYNGVVKRLCVDHNHKTGKARGLLCHECNAGIGQLRIDGMGIELLLKAIEYIGGTDGR